MSLFEDDPLYALKKSKTALPPNLLGQLGCKVCPLAQLHNDNPNMSATGSKNPVVYVLGDMPSKTDDATGRQFTGKIGEQLRRWLPHKWRDKVRYNNIIRTRPHGKDPTPNPTAVECCRPSVARDIEETKPKVIFGFGNAPLQWISGFNGITAWRGRMMPVKVGNHTCWYFAFDHPRYVLQTAERFGNSEEQRMFKFDMQRAFAEIKYLPTSVVHGPAEVFKNIKLVTEGGEEGLRQVREAIGWALLQEEVGFDYETNAIRPYGKRAKILTFAVANGEVGYSVPLDHPDAQWTQAERDEVRGLLLQFIKSKVRRKYVHNLSFELEWTGVLLGRKYVRTPGWEDTATAASIVDERRGKTKPGTFALEFLVQQYFGFNLKKLSNVDRANLEFTPLPTVLMYNGGDARYHCLLGQKLRRSIAQYGLGLPYKLGLRRVPTLVLSQMKGVPVDQEENKRLTKKYTTRIAETQAEIAKLPIVHKFEALKKRKFKPLANPDVLYVLKDMMKRKEVAQVDKYNKEIVKYQVNEKVLTSIEHPFPKAIIRLRKDTKRLSTYIEPYGTTHPSSLVWPDGRLHCTFNSYFAETSRLSCEDPNLQNVPKRQEEAREVRKQLKALLDRIILACDYGQIEARLIAVASRDKVFTKSLWDDYDVHQEWAERLARAYPSRIGGRKMLSDKKTMKDFRGDIKNQWTFPLFFGAKLPNAAKTVQIPEETLAPLYKEFWRTFSGVRQWQEDLVDFYKEHGYVETLTGRRRRGPLSTNQIFNSPIQGTAAEVVLDGMCRLSEIGDWDLQPEINIHDDLTFVDIPLRRVEELSERIITEMLAVPFEWAKRVPWSVEMSVGENWLEMEEIGTFFSHHWFGTKTPKEYR